MDKIKALAQQYCKNIQQQAARMGVQFSQPKVVAIPNDRTETYLKAIRDVITPECQLVNCIVPQQRSDRYSAIKKLCYIDKPVASQVR